MQRPVLVVSENSVVTSKSAMSFSAFMSLGKFTKAITFANSCRYGVPRAIFNCSSDEYFSAGSKAAIVATEAGSPSRLMVSCLPLLGRHEIRFVLDLDAVPVREIIQNSAVDLVRVLARLDTTCPMIYSFSFELKR